MNLSSRLNNKADDSTNVLSVTIRSVTAKLAELLRRSSSWHGVFYNSCRSQNTSSQKCSCSASVAWRCHHIADCFRAGSRRDRRDRLPRKAGELHLLFRQRGCLILVSKLCSGPCVNSFCRTVLKSVQSTHHTGAALQRKHKLTRRGAIAKEMTPSEFWTVPW